MNDSNWFTSQLKFTCIDRNTRINRSDDLNRNFVYILYVFGVGSFGGHWVEDSATIFTVNHTHTLTQSRTLLEKLKFPIFWLLFGSRLETFRLNI